MEKEPKTDANDQDMSNSYKNDNGGNSHDEKHEEKLKKSTPDMDDTDKYLAMEQPGVQYTHDHDPTANSDRINPDENNKEKKWNDEGGNSRYSDAYNQDDYMLEDNIDLDEDQNQSISSDDEDFEETNERY